MNASARGRVVVTGAAGGIGAAVCAVLAEAGWSVVAVDHDPELLRELEALVAIDRAVCGDSASPEVLEEACTDPTGKARPLRGFVANAGIARSGPSRTYPMADWDQVVRVNLSAVFEGMRTAARHMYEGAIVATSSISSHQGFAERAAYAATKAGVDGLVRSLSVELAPTIRVNSVAPGYVDTPFVQPRIAAGELDLEQITGRIPLGRFASPDEVAHAIEFLVSNRSSYITGVSLPVDGGWLAYGLPAPVGGGR